MIIKIQEALFTFLSASSDGNICAQNYELAEKIKKAPKTRFFGSGKEMLTSIGIKEISIKKEAVS